MRRAWVWVRDKKDGGEKRAWETEADYIGGEYAAMGSFVDRVGDVREAPGT